jgi:hypothetical protein
MLIAESLLISDSVAREMERQVKKNGVQAAIIDYAQLLQSPGDITWGTGRATLASGRRA